MEIDDLKNAWVKYDKKLSDNLRFNEELIRKLNMNNTKQELQKPLRYEIFSVIVLFVLIVYVFTSSIRFLDQLQFCIPGFITTGVALVYLAFAFIKIKRFLNIDYYSSPVLKLQRDILTLKKKVLNIRKYELILIPLLVLPILPILFKSIHNINIYNNIKLLVIELIIILGIGYPLTLWINKYFYDRKFANANRILAELDKFENED